MPTFEPPQPRLEYLARFHVTVADPQDLGITPWGHRRIVRITGGYFDGPRLSGEVLSGGADWQVVHPDGHTTIDTRYTLRTTDDSLIHIRTNGTRHGPADVLAAVGRGEDVDPTSYYFRLSVHFETGATRYAWLNQFVVIGAGMRTADAVRYDAYTVA